MTLSELQLDIYRRLNLSDTPPARVVNRILSFINQRHRRILTSRGVSQLRDETIPVPVVSGQAVYSLPPSVGKIQGIYDTVTNRRRLRQRSLAWLRNMSPTVSVGTPTDWTPLSLRQVQQQPSEETALYVVSTSDDDTANVTVEYTRLGGYQSSATVQMTGTTPVAVGQDNDIVSVTKFFVSSPAVGAIELSDDYEDVLNILPPGKTSTRYLSIQLFPTPAADMVLHVDHTREIPQMVLPTDEPLLPEDFHYLLSLGARIDEYEHLDDSRGLPLQLEWREGTRSLVNWISNNPDYIVIPGGGQTGWSSLGPNFPPGT